MDEIVKVWTQYLNNLKDWQAIIEGVTPKQTQCGPVYEPKSPLPDRNETFAISDMRDVKVAYPHFHKNGETEVYFVVQGAGLTVVGGKEIKLEKGSVVVTPPNTTHFTIPKSDLVMIVINTPDFNAENIVEPTESDPNIKFDKEQYERLVQDIYQIGS
jgi:mannose-6-phosphate isomerase-like protein (cupin superfamily)